MLEMTTNPVEEAFSEYPCRAVPAIDCCDADPFRHEYLSGIGRPVIVRKAMSTWPAMDQWSFRFFAERYGSEPYLTNSRFSQTTGWKRLRFDDYLLYCVSPDLSPLGTVPTERPFYSALPLIQRFPELLSDVPFPGFLENVYQTLEGKLFEWSHHLFEWIFIGPRGTVTDLHVDQFMMHTFSAQLAGSKKFRFFSPQCLRQIPGADAAEAAKAVVEKPGFRYDHQPVVHEAIVGPGEMVVFPAGWAHHVVSLEPSITVSVNFVDSTNYLEHVLSISRNLPAWAAKVNGPLFREALGAEWKGSDFASYGSAGARS